MPTNSIKQPDELGCYVVLKGLGCHDYGKIKEENFRELFSRCRNYLDNGKYHLTRLDIAIDDRNNKPYFTVEQIYKKCKNQEFISPCRSYSFSESSFKNGTAKTVYIGNRKSNLSFRIYDKDKEQCIKRGLTLEDIGTWKRTEIQLRDDKAHGFAMKIIDSDHTLGQLTFNLLSSSLRFIENKNNDTNKSRQKICDFWKRFLGNVKQLKINIDSESSSLIQTH